MRLPAPPARWAAATVSATLFAVALNLPTAFAQDEGQPGDAPALSEEAMEELAEMVADKLADRLADDLSDEVAEKVAAKLGAKLAGMAGGEDADERAPSTGPDANLRDEAFAVIDALDGEDAREALGTFLEENWPDGEPVEDHLSEVIFAVNYAAGQSNGEAQYDAFRMAGDLVKRALENDIELTDQADAGSVLYNAACAESLAGDAETAAKTLSLAVANGWDDIEYIKEDDDLAAVRDLPAFAEMYEGFEAAAEAALLEEVKKVLDGESFDLKFTYEDTDGTEHTLADYKGKVVIVDFWGTWCPPCRAEIPHFIELQDEFGPKGFQMLGLNYGDEEEEIVEFVEAEGINYPTGVGSDETRDMVPDFRGYPTTVFIDKTGKVRGQVVGMRPEKFFRVAIETLLAEDAKGDGDDAAAEKDSE